MSKGVPASYVESDTSTANTHSGAGHHFTCTVNARVALTVNSRLTGTIRGRGGGGRDSSGLEDSTPTEEFNSPQSFGDWVEHDSGGSRAQYGH
eukprot:1181186-Prorocentrum_minimum.AAC.1